MTTIFGYDHSRYYQILSNLELIAFSKNYAPLYLCPFEAARSEPTLTHLKRSPNLLSLSPSTAELPLWKWLSPSGELLQFQTDPTRLATAFAAKNKKTQVQKYVYSTQVFSPSKESPMGMKSELVGGIEYYGQSHWEADFEVISLTLALADKLNLGAVHLELGHAGFLRGLFDEMGLSTELEQSCRLAIERKNPRELTLLCQEEGIEDDKLKTLLEVIDAFGQPKEVLSLGQTLIKNSLMAEALKQLEELCKRLEEKLGLTLTIDLGFANRQQYYTGSVFKLYSLISHQPIATGGRYDHLADPYNVSLPACGANLILPNLLEVIEMNQKQTQNNKLSYALYYEKNTETEAKNLINALRQMGLEGEENPINNSENLESAVKSALMKGSSPVLQNWILSLKTPLDDTDNSLQVIDPALNQSYRTSVDVFLSQLAPLAKWQSIH